MARQYLKTGVNDLYSWCKQNNMEYLLDEWDYEKNYPLMPKGVARGTYKGVYWNHKIEDGTVHSWKSPINYRTGKNYGCPYCAGKRILTGINDFEARCKEYKRDDILELWDYEKNTKKPNEVIFGSHTRYYFRCNKCNESRYISLHNISLYIIRNSSLVCKNCCKIGTSYPEQLLYLWVKEYFEDAENRYIIDGFEFDIYVPSIKLAIEYDGAAWHKGADSAKRELNKDNKALELGINLIRVKEHYNCEETSIKGDIIYFKPENTSGYNNINEVTKLLANYINIKYGTNMLKDVTTNIKAEAREKTLYSNEGNSLQDKYPEIAKELHPIKNGSISPYNLSCKSNLKLWWKCNKCGYEWQEVVSTKVINGTKCQSCGHQPIDINTYIEHSVGDVTCNYEIEYVRLFHNKEIITSYAKIVIRLLNEIANSETYKDKLELIIDNTMFNGGDIQMDSGQTAVSNKITRDANRCRKPRIIHTEIGDIYIEMNFGSTSNIISYICRILDLCELPRDTVKIKYADKQEEGSWDLLAGIL